jgi:hypothetical protein
MYPKNVRVNLKEEGPESITSDVIGPSYVSLSLRSSVTTIGPEPSWNGDTFVLLQGIQFEHSGTEP